MTSTKAHTLHTPFHSRPHTDIAHIKHTHKPFFVVGRNTASHLLTLKTYTARKHGKRHRLRALTETSTQQTAERQKTKTLSVPRPTMSCSPACSLSGLHSLLQGLMFQAPMALGQTTTALPPSHHAAIVTASPCVDGRPRRLERRGWPVSTSAVLRIRRRLLCS